MKQKMKSLIFRFRYWLMPDEFKKGSWLFIDGLHLNIDFMWKKDKKGWYIPEIRHKFEDNLTNKI